jgi:SAM-dependent methyltransferase
MPFEPLQNTAKVQAAYDRVADEYVRRIYDELRDKPLDRRLLEEFADRLRGRGIVYDLGCGPGHVGRFLHERGVEVCGVDVSPQMIERASRLNPGMTFHQADMLGLDIPAAAAAGIVAFYSIVNFPRADLPIAFAEMHRILKPGGWLLVSFHTGNETKHVDEWWSMSVDVDFYLFGCADVAADLRAAGFRIEQMTERDPYPDVEHQSRRCYILAGKAGDVA